MTACKALWVSHIHQVNECKETTVLKLRAFVLSPHVVWHIYCVEGLNVVGHTVTAAVLKTMIREMNCIT